MRINLDVLHHYHPCIPQGIFRIPHNIRKEYYGNILVEYYPSGTTSSSFLHLGFYYVLGSCLASVGALISLVELTGVNLNVWASTNLSRFPSTSGLVGRLHVKSIEPVGVMGSNPCALYISVVFYLLFPYGLVVITLVTTSRLVGWCRFKSGRSIKFNITTKHVDKFFYMNRW